MSVWRPYFLLYTSVDCSSSTILRASFLVSEVRFKLYSNTKVLNVTLRETARAKPCKPSRLVELLYRSEPVRVVRWSKIVQAEKIGFNSSPTVC